MFEEEQLRKLASAEDYRRGQELLGQGRVQVAQRRRSSRHADIRALTVWDDNRQDLGGKIARLVAAAL